MKKTVRLVRESKAIRLGTVVTAAYRGFSAGIHVPLIQILAYIVLSNSIAPPDSDGGELTRFHEPVDRHVRNAQLPRHLGNGHKPSRKQW
jgi:hypothetical protein